MKGVYGEAAIVLENADGNPTPRPVRTFDEDEGGLVVSSRGYDPEEAFPKKIYFGDPEVGFFSFVRREKPKLSSSTCWYRCASWRNTTDPCKCTLKVTMWQSKDGRWHALHVLQYRHSEPCRFENRYLCFGDTELTEEGHRDSHIRELFKERAAELALASRTQNAESIFQQCVREIVPNGDTGAVVCPSASEVRPQNYVILVAVLWI